MNVLSWIPIAIYAYLGIGVVFSAFFAFWGVKYLDEGMASAHWGLRLLLMPGGIALWPVLLRKWMIARRQPSES